MRTSRPGLAILVAFAAANRCGEMPPRRHVVFVAGVSLNTLRYWQHRLVAAKLLERIEGTFPGPRYFSHRITRAGLEWLSDERERAVRALGYRRLVTYTLPSEGGASLRAAGFRVVGETRGGSWSRRSRPRVDTHPTQAKLRWELVA